MVTTTYFFPLKNEQWVKPLMQWRPGGVLHASGCDTLPSRNGALGGKKQHAKIKCSACHDKYTKSNVPTSPAVAPSRRSAIAEGTHPTARPVAASARACTSATTYQRPRACVEFFMNDVKLKGGRRLQMWGWAIINFFPAEWCSGVALACLLRYINFFQFLPPKPFFLISQIICSLYLVHSRLNSTLTTSGTANIHINPLQSLFSAEFLRQWFPGPMRQFLPWYAPPRNSPTNFRQYVVLF